jgi:hypothetical protein
MFAEWIRSRGWSPERAVLGSAISTSLLFGLFHLANDHASFLAVLNISLLGILFAVPVLYTGRLYFSIGLHLGWNVFQNLVFGMPNGGKPRRAAVLVTEDLGPEFWTGGAFGPEGGLIALIPLGLSIIVITVWMKRRHGGAIKRSLAKPPVGQGIER